MTHYSDKSISCQSLSGCEQALSLLPEALKKHLFDHAPDCKIIRVIRSKNLRISLHVEINNTSLLIKAMPESALWKSPDRYFRFNKEIFIYSCLDKMKFSRFLYPRLIHTDHKTFFIAEFISHEPDFFKDDHYRNQLVENIAEFNTCDLALKKKGSPGWTWERLNRWKFSKSSKTLRNLTEGLFTKKVSLSVYLKVLAFWLQAIKHVRPLERPIVLHRDIFKANILRPDSDHVYLVDFEKAGIEKRWVLCDALKIAQAEPLFFSGEDPISAGFPVFHKGMLHQYWKLVCSRLQLDKFDEDNFFMQLRFALVAWTLKKLVKEQPDPEQAEQLSAFLLHVAKGGKGFERWFAGLPK